MRTGTATLKRPTNVSLDPGLVTTAKELGINVSKACEGGLRKQIADVRNTVWLAENCEAIESWNAWVDTNGLPLEHLRQF